MPRQRSRIAKLWSVARRESDDSRAARMLPPADSAPRDWSDLGRRVLAEALHRATDELARRNALTPASVALRSTEEGQS